MTHLYFIPMETVLLGIYGTERYIYLLLHYICFKVIKSQDIFFTGAFVFKIGKPRQEDIGFGTIRR